MSYPDREDCLISGYVPTCLKTLTSYAFKRGNLTEKKYYGLVDESHPNKECLYKSESYVSDIPEGMTNQTFTGPLHTLCDFSEIDYSNDASDVLYKNYTINKYQLIPYNKRLKSKKVWEKDFYTDVETEQIVTYTYYGESDGYSAEPWNSFVRSRSFVNSRGQLVTTYYTYYKNGDIPLDMRELEITVVDNIVASARRNVYNRNHRLSKIYTGCIGISFSANFVIPTDIVTPAVYPSIDKEEYSYEYDINGNVVQISYNGKVLASYLWGYMGKHPIVEIKNVCYNDLISVAVNSNLYSETNYVLTESLLLLFDILRNTFDGEDIQTYTYHWLLGIATSTDARGVKNTYILDDFGRLSGVKDTNGFFISKYDYNYKGL